AEWKDPGLERLHLVGARRCLLPGLLVEQGPADSTLGEKDAVHDRIRRQLVHKSATVTVDVHDPARDDRLLARGEARCGKKQPLMGAAPPGTAAKPEREPAPSRPRS